MQKSEGASTYTAQKKGCSPGGILQILTKTHDVLISVLL